MALRARDPGFRRDGLILVSKNTEYKFRAGFVGKMAGAGDGNRTRPAREYALNINFVRASAERTAGAGDGNRTRTASLEG
jgi:hypothetical protein